ncbi:MAG: F0F1 ATP synthase subunit delta [Bacillota bacterium]|nr:F0F1 ATP synthase subunit delta [Bacillota bacterium]
MGNAQEKAERGAPLGHPVARVVTAGDISSQLRQEAAAKIRKLVGDAVEVVFEVDPAIIGGMVVHLPDRVIDLSLAGRFRSYGRAVQEIIGSHLQALEGWARAEGSPALSVAGLAAGKE